MIRIGRVEVAKVGDNLYEVRLGQLGVGESIFIYSLEFKASSFTNISMEPVHHLPHVLEFPEWPPTPIGGNNYALDGMVGDFPMDSFQAEDLISLKVRLRASRADTALIFDLYYRDETKDPPTEKQIAFGVTEASWSSARRWPWVLGGLAALVGLVAVATRRR